jgi:N-acyl-D-amino-acid deacylase
VKTISSIALFSLVVAAGAAGLAGPAQPEAGGPFDLLILRGRVLDGGGNPWVGLDIGIRGGRIVALGRLGGRTAARVIDAGGRVVAPGFIDVHSHAAEGLRRDALREARPLLAQGITTIVANPDGGGPVDLAAQRRELERGVGVNVALLVGHGSVRRAVMGMADRRPTAEELARMEALVRRGVREGAFGLSSGLFYAPGSYAETAELVALARAAAEEGAPLYTSHIRDEGDYSVGLLAAVDEVVRIAEEARVRGIVSHMKALGPASWGLSLAALLRIDGARARGVEVFADQYPYEASSTSLSGALVPRWAQAGGAEALRRRLADPPTRARLLEEIRENIRRRGGAASLVIASFAADRTLEGQSLEAIAARRGEASETAALDLVERGDASVVSFNMSETDIELIMRRPYTMTSSDGGLVAPGEGRPHPRNNGAFARKLARYVRERSVVPLEFAVRSMTSLPALVFGIRDRGVVREGAWADLVVFDPAAVVDRATYEDPHRLAEGMHYVVVNGRLAIDAGAFTGVLAGRVLARNGPEAGPPSR